MAGSYDGELAGSILLEDDGLHDDGARPPFSGFNGGLGGLAPSPGMNPYFPTEDSLLSDDRMRSPGGSSTASARRNHREGESATRFPDRTPSPTYHYPWEAPKKVELPRDEPEVSSSFQRPSLSSDLGQADGSSGGGAAAGGEAALFNQMSLPPFFNPALNPLLAAAAYNPGAQAQAQASLALAMQNPAMLNLMMQNPALLQASADAAASGPGGLAGLAPGSSLPAGGLGAAAPV